MDLFGTFLALVFFILFYIILNNSRSKNPKRAPLVSGAWPIIGHLPMISPPKIPHIELASLAEKYGPIFTLKIGVHSALVVNDSQLTKEIFTTHDSYITFRPSLIAGKLLGYDYALYPFAPGGPYWREMRKASTSQVLSNRRVEQLKYIMIQEVDASIKEMWRANGQIVEMKQWLSKLNLNVILRMVIGKKFFGGGVDGEKQGRKFEEGIREIFHYLGNLGLRDVVPLLGWMDIGGHEKRMKKIAKGLDNIFSKWLEEHKKRKFSGEDEKDMDFMDALISDLNGKDLGGYDADTINKATCLSLIAGYETATVSLTWAWALLLNNKHVIKKAQEEIDQHVGKERMVKAEDISKLVYVQAIVKEALRLHPPTFIPAPRLFKQDCTVGGYHVPKDTWLLVNLWKIQQDPKIWSDPMEFKPERFLTTHKEVDVRGNHFELLPFGGGRRACPATSYGIQIMNLTLAGLLHGFDISTLNDEPVDMSARIGLTSTKLTDLEIIAKARIPSYCFE